MKAVIVTSQSGDWEALYIDGRSVAQAHRITPKMLADALYMRLEVRSATDTEDECAELTGRFPDRLS